MIVMYDGWMWCVCAVQVVYEDADCEELEAHEVEELLVAMSSVPEDIFASLKVIAKGISVAGSSPEPQEEEEEEVEVLAGVQDWNTYLLKSFGDMGDFYGLVISHDKPFYKVK
jgi:hypothetical protein